MRIIEKKGGYSALALGVAVALLASPAAFAAKKQAISGAALVAAEADAVRDPGAAFARGENMCVIDMSNSTANGDPGLGDPSNTIVTVDLGPNAVVTSIGASGTMTAFSPSWLSESAVRFLGDDPEGWISLTPLYNTNTPGTSAFDFPAVDLSDHALPDITTGEAGILTLERFESFNDSGIDPDSIWHEGSTTTIYYSGGDPYACGGEPDTTAPTISAAPDREPNEAGWYNKKVTVSWTCDDAGGSGVVDGTCPEPKVYKANTTTEGVLSPAYSIFDNEGNQSDPSNQVTIRIDKIKPTIGVELDSEPNEFGWYTGDVTVHYTCEDTLSGVASCPADTVVTKRGAGVKVPKGKAVDVAGNSAPGEVTTINIDSTAPTISDVEFSGPLVVGAEVTASPVAADAQSGIASGSCDAVDTTKAKKYSVTCTATNGAGLEKSKKFYYTVEAAE